MNDLTDENVGRLSPVEQWKLNAMGGMFLWSLPPIEAPMQYVKVRGKRRLATQLVAQAWAILEDCHKQSQVDDAMERLREAMAMLEVKPGFIRKRNVNGRGTLPHPPRAGEVEPHRRGARNKLPPAAVAGGEAKA